MPARRCRPAPTWRGSDGIVARSATLAEGVVTGLAACARVRVGGADLVEVARIGRFSQLAHIFLQRLRRLLELGGILPDLGLRIATFRALAEGLPGKAGQRLDRKSVV